MASSPRRVVLHSYWKSSCAWRVRIALNLLGIDYEYKAVHLLRDGGEQFDQAFTAHSPMAQVPLLEVYPPDAASTGASPFRLTQSVAILEYLASSFPSATVTLYPSEPAVAAAVREIVEVINAGVQPLQNLAVLRRVKAVAGGDADAADAASAAWGAHWVAKGLAAADALVARHGRDGLAVSAAGGVTAADVVLVPAALAAPRFGVDVSAYPHVAAVVARFQDTEAFAKATPAACPDAA
ncbi:hypothetical protein MMPV_000851 [Pyropia vietnamensis]